MRISKSNVPAAPLRWNPERAATEFGLTHVTLRKALAKNSAQPDEHGLYTTTQIVSAIFGDLHSEKILTQRQLTRRYELNNRIVEGTVVDRAELLRLFAGVADAMTSRIEASSLTREEKTDLRRDLSSIRPGIDGIAKRQSKLPRNGPDEEDDEDLDEQTGRRPRKPRFRQKSGFVKDP
jgi:hypothetical protein